MALRWLIVLLLATAALTETVGRVSRTLAPDFYQLWGVPAAARLAGGSLGSPYRDLPGYWSVLSRHAEASSDAPRRAAHRLWPTLSPIAAPLLFVAFALLPGDYTTAVSVYAGLQALAFFGALLGLGRLFPLDRFLLVSLAFLLVRLYEPLASDMRLGNVG